MIPYFQFTLFHLGPLTIHVWGLFASLGFLIATIVAARRARLVGISPELVWSVSWQIVIAGIVGSRLFEVLFYDPRYHWANPSQIFSLSSGGLSSTGGIIGGALVLILFIRRHRLELYKTLDVFAYAAPLGIMIGRIGCFLIHDHPGTLTSFIGGVRYPGGVRHDGGLEMAIADGLIFLVFVLVAHHFRDPSPRGRGRGEGIAVFPDGSFVLLFIGLKGLSRFWLDFYRATDIVGAEARYHGLTPSQYAGLFAIVCVMLVLYRQRMYVNT